MVGIYRGGRTSESRNSESPGIARVYCTCNDVVFIEPYTFTNRLLWRGTVSLTTVSLTNLYESLWTYRQSIDIPLVQNKKTKKQYYSYKIISSNIKNKKYN